MFRNLIDKKGYENMEKWDYFTAGTSPFDVWFKVFSEYVA